MFVNDVAPRTQHTATSGQTLFNVPFEFLKDDDLIVIRNGVTLTLAASPADVTEYSVIGEGSTGGGSITLGGGATLSDVITIIGSMPYELLTVFPPGGPFLVPALNAELVRYMLLMKQLDDDISRTLRVPPTDLTSDLSLPSVSLRANKWLAFDANGAPMAVEENGVSVITGSSRVVVQNEFVATEGQTTFIFSYDLTTIFATVNGIIIPQGEYVATSGSEVVFTDGLRLGDEVTFVELQTA